MTPAELKEIGQLLFGLRWKSSLARAIGRSRRTIHYWTRTDKPLRIPNGAAGLLRELAAKHNTTGESS